MSEFTAIDLSSTNIPGVCLECSKQAIVHNPSGSEFCWCSHEAVGVWRRVHGRWHVKHGLSLDQFKEAITLAVVVGEARHVQQTVKSSTVKH